MPDSTTAFTERPTLKRCSRCGQRLPLACFRRRSKGSDKPHADCRECNRLDQRRRRAKKTGRIFRRLASDVHRYRGSSIDRLALLVSVTLDRFGGLDRFVRSFKQTHNRAMKRGELSLAFRILRTIMELALEIEKVRTRIDQEIDDATTTEELHLDMRRQFIGMLVEFGESDEDARRIVERILSRSGARTRETACRWGREERAKM